MPLAIENSTKVQQSKRFAKMLKTAARVFAKEGYEKASIRRISRELGKSISALYHYVETKEELLFLIQKDTFLSLVNSLEEKLSDIVDSREKIRVMVNNHVSHFLKNMSELKVCFHELDSLTGKAYKEVLEIRREYFLMTRNIVKEIILENSNNYLDENLATLNLFGMLNWIYMWHDPKRKQSAEYLSDQITRLFLSGLISENNSSTTRNIGKQKGAEL